jgi:Organic solute transporter Ostalpha
MAPYHPYQSVEEDDDDQAHNNLSVPIMNRNQRNETKKSLCSGVCVNRIIILVLLAILAAGGVYFQSELTEQEQQLHDEEQTILKLQTVLQRHELMIQRFNSSVTNSDVVEQLKSLKEQLHTNENNIRDELDHVKSNIDSQLASTMIQLNRTVSDAEQTIHDEVNRVKADVDSYVRTTQDQFSMENNFMVYQLAGTFTLLSCLISMWHMTAHLRKFQQPIVQRKILAILWMCPIYAITSWFSLVFHSAEGYLAILKDFYEAYVIYQFLSFCVAVIGRGDREAVVNTLAKHASHLNPPFRFDALCNKDPYENDRALADAVLLQCQSFAMQFVFLKPTTTLASFVLEKIKYYGPTGNRMDYRSPQVYIVGVQNLSVFIAFTGLLKFYHAVDKDLAWCRPFAKFLCIKGVVFMTFWQGLAISILAQSTDVGGNDAGEWARSAQNFLICLEMLLFSIAHFYTFPTDEWQEGYRASREGGKFGDTIALGDFFQDLKLILRTKKKFKKSKKADDDSLTTLEEAEEEEEDEDLASNANTEYDEEHAIQDLKKIIQNADSDAVERMDQLTDRILDDVVMHPQDTVTATVTSTIVATLDVEAEEFSTPMGQYSGGGYDDLNWLNNSSVGASERTGLLNSREGREGLSLSPSQHAPILRPSIFTTLSEVAEKSPHS